MMNDEFIEGKQTDVIYIDFCKAFDKVNLSYDFIKLIDLILVHHYYIGLNRI